MNVNALRPARQLRGHRGSERLRLPAITVNGKTQPQFATSLRIGQ